jgi:hypothetical protein
MPPKRVRSSSSYLQLLNPQLWVYGRERLYSAGPVVFVPMIDGEAEVSCVFEHEVRVLT